MSTHSNRPSGIVARLRRMLTSSQRSGTRHLVRRQGLRLEALEDRLAPATLTVISAP